MSLHLHYLIEIHSRMNAMRRAADSFTAASTDRDDVVFGLSLIDHCNDLKHLLEQYTSLVEGPLSDPTERGGDV